MVHVTSTTERMDILRKTIIALTTFAIVSTSFVGKAYGQTYTVRPGDTLYKIAQNYGTTVQAIKDENGLTSNVIYANQNLNIPSSARKTYTVVSGDSLYKIANKFGVTIQQLKAWNRLNSDRIYVGQTLVVANNSLTNTYHVKPGDTLSGIGKRFGVTVAQLRSWNNLSSDVIYAGQTLKVSAPSTNKYVVQPGDTLGHIAKKYNVTVQQLKAWNGLTSDLIKVGQTLTVSKPSTTSQSGSVPTPTKSFSSRLVEEAKKHVGTPYAWGGTSPSGFDCSGFIYYVFNQAGKSIQRLTTEGYFAQSYKINQPNVGDLVFFANTYKEGISHMGIYIGNNQFIHASSSNGVAITKLDNPYWSKYFVGYYRFK
jgi:peptidoglycan DL-endopeptidase LytE